MAVVEGEFGDGIAASQGSVIIEGIAFFGPCPLLAIEASVPAGFPSPSADFVEGRIDLQDVLVLHPSATFTVRVSGWSLQRAGIHDQDIAIVDRSLPARHDDIVIAVLDGSLTIKRLLKRGGRVVLAPDSDDPTYRAIDITGREDAEIWGVVTSTIRIHRR